MLCAPLRTATCDSELGQAMLSARAPHGLPLRKKKHLHGGDATELLRDGLRGQGSHPLISNIFRYLYFNIRRVVIGEIKQIMPTQRCVAAILLVALYS